MSPDGHHSASGVSDGERIVSPLSGTLSVKLHSERLSPRYPHMTSHVTVINVWVSTLLYHWLWWCPGSGGQYFVKILFSPMRLKILIKIV